MQGTSRTQRIIIWVIAIMMLVGTIGSFAMLIVMTDNQQNDSSMDEQAWQEYLKQYEEEMKAASEKNAKNSRALEGYAAKPFDGDSVKKLGVEVIESGTGAEVKATDTLSVSYFGWLSDGTIFDSTYKKDAEADSPVPLSLNQVIQGWTNGLKGQRVGSVVKLTIPSDLGYGASGSGIIPANAPLQFIVIINEIVSEG